MNTRKQSNRILAIVLSLCMVFTMLPMGAVTAQAEGNVAYIGDTGYTSLGAAVSAASSGDMITLEADDATAQSITISKDLTIELNGHNLTHASFNITSGNVVIRDRQGVATISCGYKQAINVKNSPDRRIHATILITGGKLTLDGVSVNGYNDVKNYYLPKAVFIGGGDVTINSGNFTGGDANNSGGDAVYFHKGTLTINGGTFIGGTDGGCGLSSTSRPGDSLNIRHGTFIGGGGSSAFWLGISISNESSLKNYFLSEDNYIVGDFDSKNVTIGTDFFLSPVFTEPENGSANANEPATIYLATGDSATLEPHVLGGEGGTLTYEWYKDDTKIDGASGSSYTVSGEGDFAGDYHAVISEVGTDRSHDITVYWRVIKLAHSHNVCGEGECTHSGHTSVEYTALDNGAGGLAEGVIATSDSVYGSTLKEGNYYLTADLTLSEPLAITSAVHICLNGNTLTFTDEAYGFHLGGRNANPEAELTVCDCSAEETGEIVTTADKAKTIYNRSGDIFVYGGMISGEDNAIYTADHSDAGNMYIFGGKITTTGYNSAINILAKDNGNRKLIISVGEIEGIDSYMPMEISGGTITDDVYAYSDVTMTGGTINGQLTINSSEKKNVKISGNARIEATSGNAIYSKENIDLEISGGTITAQNGYAIRLTNSQSKIYLSGNPVISGKSADIEIMPTSSPDFAVLVLREKEGTGNKYTGDKLSISSCGTENKDLYLAQKVDSVDMAAKFSLASPADCYLAYDDANNAIQIKERTYTVTLPSGQKGYTVTAESGSTSPVDKNGSYSFTMTISDGYYTTDDFIVKANETELKPDDNGVYTISNITADQTVTVEGVALDEKAPSVKIQLENNEWKEFLNNITFGLFFKENKTVTISGTDDETGVAKTEYIVTDTIYESVEALEAEDSNVWNKYSDPISIEPNSKNVIYAKVTDNAGNVSYASSNGIVLYTDAAQKTESISFTKTSEDNVTAEVTLNGNTIDEIYCGDTKLNSGTDYTVSGGTITFDADWLDELVARDDYTLTVHYKPMGEEYVDVVGNVEPSTTTMALSVEKTTGNVEITNDISKIYNGIAVSDIAYTKSSTGNVTVEYKLKDAEDSTYTTTKPSAVGDYTVRVTVATDENYTEASATKDFSITYLSKPDNPFTVSGTQVTNGWYTDNVEIKAPDGYTVSSALDGTYSDSVTISKSSEKVSIHLKNDQKQITDVIFVGDIKIDKDNPTITVTGNTTDYLQNDTVQIEVSDNTSGVAKIEVKKDDGEFVDITDSYASGYSVTENGTYTFRVTDNAGRTTETTLTYDKLDSIKPVVSISATHGDESYSSGIWTNRNVVLTPKNNSANLGTITFKYKVDDEEWQDYTDSIVVSEDTDVDGVTYTFKAISASDVESEEVSIIVKRDTVLPEVGIFIENNSIKEFLNDVTFGLFFKNTQNVSVLATDASSDVAKTEYFITDTVYEDSATLETGANGKWVTYSGEFSIKPNSKNVIYAKVTDNAGNVKYISSEGIVLYTDAQQDTKGISFTKTGTADVAANVILNGNTIDEIYCGDTKLVSGTDYTVSKGTIAFKASWLDTLAAGNYILTVHYNPFGEEYVDNSGNVAPATTTIALSVEKATGSVEITNDISKIYDEKVVSDVAYTKSSTGDATVEYKVQGADDSTYTTTKPSAVGKYTVHVTVGEDENYTEASATKDFEITYLSEPEVPFIIPDDQTNGWYKGEVEIKAPDGYTISSTLEGEYSESITISESTENVVIYLQNKAGQITDAISIGDIQIDTAAPEVDINIDENSIKTALNEISFGLFFNKNIDVEITATDDLSGVASIEYYISSEPLQESELEKVQWISSNNKNITDSVTIAETAEDAKQLIYYARVTDEAGNVTIVASNGIVFDLTPPAIEGIDDGQTYYTTQQAMISDANLVADQQEMVILEGNTDEQYVVIARDKAGNETVYTINMKPISDLVKEIEGLTEANVNSMSEEEIAAVKEKVNSILEENSENATEEELSELNSIIDRCDVLQDKIDQAGEALNSEELNKTEDITADNVTLEDKDTLESALTDLQEALKNNESNYTEEEIASINADIDRIEKALQSIEKAESVSELIEALPGGIDISDENSILAAKEAYDALTENEKAMVGNAFKDKLDTAIAKLEKAKEEAQRAKTGDDTSLADWIVLLTISSSALACLVYERRRKNL